MTVKIEESWKNALAAEFEKPYFTELTAFVRGEYNKWAAGGAPIYPKPAEIFNAFNLCPFDAVKVVIIGQDPYHQPGQAHGLCFSVRDGVAFPPSLQNIYKEIADDLGRPSVTHGDLTRWAEQGVLLLNSTLTVQANLAASHAGKGWEQFTDAAIRALSARSGIVYLLWGSYAQRKAEFVNGAENLILKSVHPSPLSAHRGFFGNKQFSKTNEYLVAAGKEPIEW
ncbi:MAG: uracil-DNA glycosylase [Alphaproteobacteria bacterium]|nr:uracil-DNA glycosylase [Alphaproteobacteria bacterium]